MYGYIYRKLTHPDRNSPDRSPNAAKMDPFTTYKQEYVRYFDKKNPVYQRDLRKKNKEMIERFAQANAEKE